MSGRNAALIVPSAVITVERNILLNPLNPQAKRISVLSEDDFTFDPRLLT
jgi:RES domain-containing protein